MKQSVKYTNSLINETSPYLLQHAHNPVQWNPWTEETIQTAKSLDKPIFLSIGYSACHWCHVMEKESFENEEVAAILNENFINIKVDREERPDLDEIYMEAVQVMANNGGWPMSLFLTPDLYPFYGGTYYPPEDRHGLPGFKRLILSISALWHENRGIITDNSRKVGDVLEQLSFNTSGSEAEPVNEHSLLKAQKGLLALYDNVHGGFGSAPKFPHASAIEFLLNRYFRTHDAAVLASVEKTLDAMALGGIYDHVGGGFHRYSTDHQWLIPHFEKMLYDNALLSDVYQKAFQMTRNPLYKKVAQDVFGYVLREMTSPQGGFFATQDADTSGKEGLFYLWTYQEIIDLLGEQDGRLYSNYYTIRPEGNFRSHESYHIGQNIPHRNAIPAPVQYNPGISNNDLDKKIEGLNAILLEARNRRTAPLTDDKIITAWNGLMISSLAHGYQIFDDSKYLNAAQKSARFILSNLYKNGNLYHSYRNGIVKEYGFLDDYAFFIVSLIDLYEASFDVQWLIEAEKLAKAMIENFQDTASGGFYFTSVLHKNLIIRKKSLFDGAIPSGNSMAAYALLRLSKFFDNQEFRVKAEKIITATGNNMYSNPVALSSLLKAADLYVYQPDEIALIASHNHDDLKNMLQAVNSRFIPNKVIAVLDNEAPERGLTQEKIPLLKEKTAVSGKTTAYVCRNFSCLKPVTNAEDLIKLLSENRTESITN